MYGTTCGDERSFLPGLILAVMGVAFLASNFGYFDVGDFWPLVFVAMGVWIMSKRTASAFAFGTVWVIAGSVLFARELGYTRIGWGELWPLFLIAGGLSTLAHHSDRNAGRAS